MEDTIFSNRARTELTTLFELLQQTGKYEDLDIDLQDDVLYITLPTNRQYVINRHTPSKQIWLSSPLTGADYFSYNDQDWHNKSGGQLKQLLMTELAIYE